MSKIVITKEQVVKAKESYTKRFALHALLFGILLVCSVFMFVSYFGHSGSSIGIAGLGGVFSFFTLLNFVAAVEMWELMQSPTRIAERLAEEQIDREAAENEIKETYEIDTDETKEQK